MALKNNFENKTGQIGSPLFAAIFWHRKIAVTDAKLFIFYLFFRASNDARPRRQFALCDDFHFGKTKPFNLFS